MKPKVNLPEQTCASSADKWRVAATTADGLDVDVSPWTGPIINLYFSLPNRIS